MKNSKKGRVIQVVQEIQVLLEELKKLFSINDVRVKGSLGKGQITNYSGASGGIRMLLDDNYFKETRSLSEVTMRLKQEGFNYSKNTVSMALLRAVQARFLVRLPAEGHKGRERWVYVIRK
ncbi:MAG: hypothetical protein WC705_03060 [Candidatus Paceibacterota bacterium]|jgi:hypothetical protein